MFAYVDSSTPAGVASKILVYSREMQIDKVAEIIGGKDDKFKVRYNILHSFIETSKCLSS